MGKEGVTINLGGLEVGWLQEGVKWVCPSERTDATLIIKYM